MLRSNKRYLRSQSLNNQSDVDSRQPGKSSRTSLLEDTMTVGLHLLTGSKSHKRQQHVSQFDKYFNDIQIDFMSVTSAYKQLLNDPWRWWLKDSRNRYPIVFKMAVDYRSINSTSCGCERTFSSAQRTITWDSGFLTEAPQFQKNWLRRGAVDSKLFNLQRYTGTLKNVCVD